jgi:hypothetical protein
VDRPRFTGGGDAPPSPIPIGGSAPWAGAGAGTPVSAPWGSSQLPGSPAWAAALLLAQCWEPQNPNARLAAPLRPCQCPTSRLRVQHRAHAPGRAAAPLGSRCELGGRFVRAHSRPDSESRRGAACNRGACNSAPRAQWRRWQGLGTFPLRSHQNACVPVGDCAASVRNAGPDSLWRTS